MHFLILPYNILMQLCIWYIYKHCIQTKKAKTKAWSMWEILFINNFTIKLPSKIVSDQMTMCKTYSIYKNIGNL